MNDPFADAQKREQVRLQAAAQQHAADLARQQAEENQRQQDLRKQQLVLQQQLAEKTQILLTFKVREKLEYIRQQWQCVWNRSPIQLDPTYEEGHLTSWVLHFEYIELERKITGGYQPYNPPSMHGTQLKAWDGPEKKALLRNTRRKYLAIKVKHGYRTINSLWVFIERDESPHNGEIEVTNNIASAIQLFDDFLYYFAKPEYLQEFIERLDRKNSEEAKSYISYKTRWREPGHWF